MPAARESRIIVNARPKHACGARRRAAARACIGAVLLAALAAPAAQAATAPELRELALAHEHGSNGLPRDGAAAAAYYCEAARLGDAESQYNLGWMLAHGRGVPRDDAQAAYFFRAAADQGVRQAATLVALLGDALPAEPPPCMREPEPPAPPATPAAPPAPAPFVVPAWAPAPIVKLVHKMAPEYRVPLPLVFAIMAAESNFNPAAVSPKNAQGLMQLIPDTAERFGVRNAFDPAQNLRGGLAYLRWLLAYFEGDVALVAAAYNAGEGTVERYLGVPPFSETQAYVRRILAAAGPLAQPFDPKVVEPSPLLAKIRAKAPAR